jgi:hypothetical protein
MNSKVHPNFKMHPNFNVQKLFLKLSILRNIVIVRFSTVCNDFGQHVAVVNIAD